MSHIAREKIILPVSGRKVSFLSTVLSCAREVGSPAKTTSLSPQINACAKNADFLMDSQLTKGTGLGFMICQGKDMGQLLVHYEGIWPIGTLPMETSPDP